MITKAILTASYDNDGCEDVIEEKAVAQYKKEAEKGYYFPTHVFLRDTGRHKATKFNFLMQMAFLEADSNVPLISFPLMNLSKTNLEKMAVVGDEITGAVVDAFSDFFRDTRFEFGHEGKPEEWRFSRTIREGKRILNPEKDELVMVLMGDVPLKWNFDDVLNDPDINSFDVVYNFNSRTRTNRRWPREYHLRIAEAGRHLLVKEAQLFLANLGKLENVSYDLHLEEPFVDMIYSSRKTHGNKGKSRKEKLEELFANDGRWWSTIMGLGPLYALQLWYYKSMGRTPLIKPRNVYKAIKDSIGLRVLFKADNDDPGSIEDIDGLADWANMTEMLQRGRDSIYPYYSELMKFGKTVIPDLRKRFDFYYCFEEYMNSLFRGYGLLEPYIDGKTFQNPFTLNKDASARRARRIIKSSIRYHQRYNRRH